MRTLRFSGYLAPLVADVGVAGLWRLMQRLDELRAMRILIVPAGMDAALPSVIGGLVPCVVIAVPAPLATEWRQAGRPRCTPSWPVVRRASSP